VLFAICCWRFLLGLGFWLPGLEADDVPLRVTSGTALWAAMTALTGLLFAVCLFWSIGNFLLGPIRYWAWNGG
jgi:hypothetical protein